MIRPKKAYALCTPPLGHFFAADFGPFLDNIQMPIRGLLIQFENSNLKHFIF